MKKSNLLIVAMIIGLSVAAAAQGRATATLTTDDVLKWRAANPERAQLVLPAAPKPAQAPRPEQRISDTERDWNTRLNMAKAVVRTLERESIRAEARGSETRNRVFFQDADQLNANNGAVADYLAAARSLQRQAEVARVKLAEIVDEGRRLGYRLTGLSPTLDNGAPNVDYYRGRYLEIQREYLDAAEALEVQRLRTNRFNTVINATFGGAAGIRGPGLPFYPNNGAADLYYANRLRSSYTLAAGDVDSTRIRLAQLASEMEALQDEGRRAGLPPGVFR